MFTFACVAGNPRSERYGRRFTVKAPTLNAAFDVAKTKLLDGEQLLTVNGVSPRLQNYKPSGDMSDIFD